MELSRRVFLKAGGFGAGGVLGAGILAWVKTTGPARLRPPGAAEEPGLLAACIGCGRCVEACPHQVLHLGEVGSGAGLDVPYLAPRERPCNLCQGEDEMKCAAACPTGALRPPARRRDVRMGLAEIDPETCLPWNGVSCRACWHACPFPNEAIEFDARGRAVVRAEGCVGCGMCEHACLTETPAIRVRPASQSSRVRDLARSG